MIHVLGKERLHGKSKKTGNDYDFTILHVSEEMKQDVDRSGSAVRTETVSSELASEISVGEYYEPVYKRLGNSYRLEELIPV